MPQRFVASLMRANRTTGLIVFVGLVAATTAYAALWRSAASRAALTYIGGNVIVTSWFGTRSGAPILLLASRHSGGWGRRVALTWYVRGDDDSGLVRVKLRWREPGWEVFACERRDGSACDARARSEPARDAAATLSPVAVAEVEKGREYHRDKDYEAAIAAYTRALELSPRAPSAYYWRAIAWWQSGRIEAAIPDIRRAAELDPGHFHAVQHIHWMLDERGETASALPYWNRYLALNPYDGRAYAGRAESRLARGEAAAAITDAAAACELDHRRGCALYEAYTRR